jgi:uncharacterized protein YqhQ
MRNNDRITLAVRREDGEIITKNLKPLFSKRPRKIPFVRGIFNLIEVLILGIKALGISAQIAAGQSKQGEGEERLTTLWLMLSIFLGFGIGIGIFLLLPLYLTHALMPPTHPITFNLVEGGLRIGIFLLYLYVVSLIKDIRRVFEYHGAEHKTIYAYENQEELTVENTAKYSTLHPRCGTAFLLVVLVMAIFIFSLVGDPPLLWRMVLRILLLPVIAAFSYEILMYLSKHRGNPLVRLISAPGLWLQKLTTREPSADQLEVAIAALKRVLPD